MIDRRKHYILVIDTETANTLTELLPAVFDKNGNVIKPERTRLDMSSTLVYDCGWAVTDTHGNIYETASFVNRDIFNDERNLMRTAYYADKIPRYIEELRAGTRTMANTWEIREEMLETIKKYCLKEWAAYNAGFDQNALNNTQRYHTGSKYRYWFPFNSLEPWDILKMARDVIAPMPTYQEFCMKHGFLSTTGKPSMSAENVYRFIIGNPDFEESHTGLEDVLIEIAIMAYCFRQHKPMRKTLYNNPKEFPESTDFQHQLLASLKEQPMIRVGL